MSGTLKEIGGACHCGNIRYVFTLPEPVSRITARACGCTFCVKHGGVYTSHPGASLTARIDDHEAVNRYRFGHGTADFYICQRCGVVPFVVSEVQGSPRAVVNARTFEGVDCAQMEQEKTDFDGETTDSRLARRARNWIAHVTIT
ncbi:MAG: hypothetical protein GKR94_19450 [Gammaproteobacteria bacterium]|nr:hypothetical protein [Gammaproteobacteria bacterium]